ncbi:hypothetical protein QEN19_003416 [Hanseniaspora menglaensis]
MIFIYKSNRKYWFFLLFAFILLFFGIWQHWIRAVRNDLIFKDLQFFYDYSKTDTCKKNFIEKFKASCKHTGTHNGRDDEILIKEYNKLDDNSVYANSLISKYMDCYLDQSKCSSNPLSSRAVLKKRFNKIKNKLHKRFQVDAVTVQDKRYETENEEYIDSIIDDEITNLETIEVDAIEKFEQMLLYRDKSLQWLSVLQDHNNFAYDSLKMELISTGFRSKNGFSRQPYVANGFVGLRISNLGFGFSHDNDDSHGIILNNSWPLHNRRYTGAYIADFFCLLPELPATNFPEIDKDGWSSVISAIPYWNDWSIEFVDEDGISHKLDASDPNIDPSSITEYTQILSMKTGIVTTSFVWLGKIKITTEVIANKKVYSIGSVVMDISYVGELNTKGKNATKLIIESKLQSKTGERIDILDYDFLEDKGVMYMQFSPVNVPYSTAGITQAIQINTCSEQEESLRDSLKSLIKHRLNSRKFSQDYKEIFVKDEKKESLSHQIIFDNWSSNLKNCRTVRLTKLVSIYSSEFLSDKSKDPLLTSQNEIMTAVDSNAVPLEYHKLKILHLNRWSDFYKKESFIEIPSDILLEVVIRASLFHLISNLRESHITPERGLPVSPSGITSDSYGGMVFWDSDFWVMPSLIPFFPKIAKNILMYRNASVAEARANCVKHGFEDNGMVCYPWTAARFSNETSTGPAVDYEYHINIDIVYSFMTYYLAGNFNENDDGYDSETFLKYTLWPMMSDVCKFMSAYVTYDDVLYRYETFNLTDPDEYANHINNGAYTNFGIKTLFGWAIDFSNHLEIEIPERWIDIYHKMYIPVNEYNITIEYEGMNSSIITKQADVLLNIFPLGTFNKQSNYENALNDLKFYTLKQATDGPAMSYQIYVAVVNSILNHGCSSQSFLYKSVIPYIRLPFGQFSEQADDYNKKFPPAFPFLTAHGAFLQSIVFGLTGLRFNYFVNDGKIEKCLEFNPRPLKLLPGGISIRNFKYLEGVLDITIADDIATISYKLGTNPIVIKVPNRECLECHQGKLHAVDEHGEDNLHDTYYLKPFDTLELEMYEIEENIPGNLAECKLITSLSKGAPSELSVSANDGNNETHYQPYDMTETNLIIDIGPRDSTVLKGGMILWGERPAKKFSVFALPNSRVTEITEMQDADMLIRRYPHLSSREVDFKLNELEVALASGKIPPESFKALSIPLIRDFEVEPSHPYNQKLHLSDEVKIPPSNETLFSFDYTSFCKHDEIALKKNPNPNHEQNIYNKPENQQYSCSNFDDFETRFVMISFEGIYGWEGDYELPLDGDDSEKFGATLQEIALF